MTARSWLARGALVAVLVALGGADVARGNGETQREIRGRVVSVNPREGVVVVERTFRDRTTRVTLRVPSAAPVFTCSDERPALDRVQTGMPVSVFYEPLGSEGVANLVVVEPTR